MDFHEIPEVNNEVNLILLFLQFCLPGTNSKDVLGLSYLHLSLILKARAWTKGLQTDVRELHSHSGQRLVQKIFLIVSFIF